MDDDDRVRDAVHSRRLFVLEHFGNFARLGGIPLGDSAV
jgi:hypothetical protein